ncbi:MAG: hypothetical protein WBG37_08330 [Desulfobacterales bacterium]
MTDRKKPVVAMGWGIYCRWVSAIIAIGGVLLGPGGMGTASAQDDRDSIAESSQQAAILETEDDAVANGTSARDCCQFGVSIEFNADYSEFSDIEDRGSHSLTDVYIGTLEAEFKARITPWLSSTIVLSVEDFRKTDESTDVKFDEYWARVHFPGDFGYAAGGKRIQPFGFFENHLISDTIAEALYEIDDIGLTLGIIHPHYGLDASLTIYKGRSVVDNLLDLELIDQDPSEHSPDPFNSYIANLTWRPGHEAIRAGVSYATEPGEVERIHSLGAAVTLRIRQAILDAELIAALDRDPLPQSGSFNDYSWFVALAWELGDHLELAGRYEHFDVHQSGTAPPLPETLWTDSIRSGINYFVTEWATLSLEYGNIRYETSVDSEAVGENNELRLQLALEF